MKTKKEKVIKTGLIGELMDVKLFCNEKDKNRGKFLFKCGKGCEHNPQPPKKEKCVCLCHTKPNAIIHNCPHCNPNYNSQPLKNWKEELLLYFSAGNETSFDEVKSFIQKELFAQREEIIESVKRSLETFVWDMDLDENPTISIIENRKKLNKLILNQLKNK